MEPIILTLRTYKNRELQALPKTRAAQYWDDGLWWGEFGGPLTRSFELDSKYPGHSVWKVSPTGDAHTSRTVPCKALVVARLTHGVDQDHEPYNLSYTTVQVHPPAPASGGFVLVKLQDGECEVDHSALSPRVWKQLGRPGNDNIYLLRLGKDPSFRASIHKDDATGEAYPYIIEAVYMLRRKKS